MCKKLEEGRILIIVKEVGGTNTGKGDKKIKRIVSKTKGKVFIYCQRFFLNETGEYLRSKGVKILSTETAEPGQIFKDDFDEIVEIGTWAKDKGKMFNLTKKKENKDKSKSKSNASTANRSGQKSKN